MYRIPVFKRTLALACSLMFAFPFSLRGYAFERFTMGIFRHEMAGSTIDLHYTLTDPGEYGIREEEPSFGNFGREAAEKEADYLEDCREKLSRFRRWGLREEDRLTADLLDWWLEGRLLSETYYYYQEPLGPTLGIQAQLPVLLAEFPFRKERDVEIYLELLEKLPEYFGQIAAFEKEKSEQGLFMTDEALDQILEQCRSFFPVGQEHFLVSSFRERLEECDFIDPDQKITYEAENLRALNRSVEPAYTGLCRELERLRGTGTNPYGLYHTPEGIRYYEYLLKYSVGTDLGMAEIHRLLEDQMESDYETILYALQQGVSLSALEDVPAAESPKEILAGLQEQIREDFPQTGEVAWQIKEVPDSLSGYLSPAFYMTPAMDAPQQNVIYINPSSEPDRTELVTTLAHEGYPGHLYQNSFENTESYAPVRNLFYVGGYTEGWGLYSEYYAYDLLGRPEAEGDFLRAMSSLNFAVCASLDLAVHGEGWTEEECRTYLASFGIKEEEQVHSLYLNILEEPSNYLKYYLGYLEICRLKEQMFELHSEWNELDFHTWFLQTGPAPFMILREQSGVELSEIPLELFQGPGQDVHLLAFEAFHDRADHLLVKGRVFGVGGSSLLGQREEDDPLVLGAADAGHVALFHQIVDGGRECTDSHGHSPGDGGHVPWFADADGIYDMHIVDGYLFKTARDQSPVFHIQHLVEQHHKQIIQKLFILQAASLPYNSVYLGLSIA